MKIDLNADLGEHEPPSRTRLLMTLIDSANIAAGGHAGTVKTMEATVGLALQHKVQIGAHPGFVDAAGFGREARSLSPGALETLLFDQMDALNEIIQQAGGTLHHVKLHGALYHAVEDSRELAQSYLEFVQKRFPGIKIYALAGGGVVQASRQFGVEVWGEAFADRGYLPNGHLIPRGDAGDVIHDVDEAIAQLEVRLDRDDGDVKTVCLHADSPMAENLARKLAGWLRQRHDED